MTIGRCARFAVLTIFLLLSPLLAAVPDSRAALAPSPAQRAAEAQGLVTRAQRNLARGSVEYRRMAVQQLERATQLDPDNADYQLMLARAYYRSGYLRAAMKRFERVAALQPDDAGARYGLGQVWRRDWLKYLDKSSLDHAIRELVAAVRADSTHVDGWLMLSSLLTAKGDSTRALLASEAALLVAPERPDARIAHAAGLWRTGAPEEADAEFRAALPMLERRVRERFDDFAPLASERDTSVYNHLSPNDKREFARRFWAEHDPDLATTYNEAQLEYWTRVTQAYFLYYDTKHHEWDERGELLVRYGPPEVVDYNPLGMTLFSRGAPGTQMQFPMNVLVWSWPSLGMRVVLQDRVLSEYYLLPTSSDRDMDPIPQPDSVGRRDAIGTHGLRGVFPTLPPGVKRLPLRSQIARFVTGAGPQLFAAVEVPARPGDAFVADCVVLDSLQREVARSSRGLSPSACRADSFRVADFSFPLPPGEYHVGFSVHAPGTRGTQRVSTELMPVLPGLLVSDLTVTCDAPVAPGPSVRLDANPSLEVAAGDPLTAYFEVYGLATDEQGMARFEYSYRVRSATRDRRVWLQRLLQPAGTPPELDGTWRGEHSGGVRRQYVSVPLQSLPPGSWRLEVRVRDQITGEEAARETHFTRLPSPVGTSH